jgi:hypothetical protein
MGVAPAGFPSLIAEVAFASNPGSGSPTWTDITDYVRGFSTKRGRSDELQHYSPGTITLDLENADGRFDATYTGGAYYPNVKPMKLVRLRATWNAITYPIYLGFADGFKPSWPQNKQDRVQLNATDAFKVLTRKHYVNAAQPQETIATRVAGFLTLANLTAAYNGSGTVVAADSLDTDMLSHLQALEETEAGSLFIDEAGQVRFEDRHYRSNNKLTLQATFGDGDSGELPYEVLEPLPADDTQIINYASIQASKATFPLSTPAVFSDATSDTAYGTSSIERDLLVADANECADMAWALVQRFKDPAVRFDSLEFNPAFSPTLLWPKALGLVIGDLVRCIRRTPSGNTIDQQCHIDAIEHSYDATSHRWKTRWGLSPKAPSISFWKLDDAVQSVLGTTTVFNY